MSFSGQVKSELCRTVPAQRCCALAQCFGILLYCNTFTGDGVRIVTESRELGELLPKLFRKAFGFSFDGMPEALGTKRCFGIWDPGKLRTILEAYGFSREDTVALHVNLGVLEEDCCKIAFLRGAFLAGGSVTDPAKGYHLELTTSHSFVSRETSPLIQEMLGVYPKLTKRGGSSVLYFKQSNSIEDFLTLLGAPLAAMEIMNAKAEKDLRGSVNRRVNCDAHNLDKAVDAAQEQIEAIYTLEQRGMLAELPDKLKEAVDLRMAHPEMTLSQLCTLCDPPVSKSALNHRLRKLLGLAKR